jgi:hypothetical protein
VEVVDCVRILWRHRLVAILGAPVIVAIALLGTHRVSLSPFSLTPSRQVLGIASVKVLVDTPKSQLVDLDQAVDEDASTLPTRVRVLVDDMAGESSRTALARELGVPAAQIDVSPFANGPTYTTTLAKHLGEASLDGDRPYVVNLNPDHTGSIVSIDTTAPSAAEANRLAQAALSTFARRVRSDGGDRGFVATALGRPRQGQVLVGARKAMTAAVGLIVLSVWLFAIIVAGGLAAARPAQVAEA